MKRFILILIACCLASGAYADGQTEADSLYRVAQTLPHDSTRLEMLKKLAQIEQLTPKCITYSNLLREEATLQNNDKYNTIAAYLHTVYYYNQSNRDSVKKWLDIMEPYARKSKTWDLYFDALRFQTDLYTYEEQYELAINEANQMFERAKKVDCVRGLIGAKQCLGNAYIGTERWDEGMKALEEAYQLSSRTDNAVVRISILCQLIAVAKDKQNNKQLSEYLGKLKETLQQHTATNPMLKEAFYDVYLFGEVYYTYYYLNTGQSEQAHESLEKAGKYLTPNTFFMYRVLYYDAYAAYYRTRKEYDKALTKMDSTVILLQEDRNSNYIHQQLSKADLLVEAGRSAEALPLYIGTLHLKDSIETTIFDKQMQQIKAKYNIDKVALEEEQLKSDIQLTALVIVGIVLAILIVFMLHISHVRKALELSEKETRKATRMAEEANEMKNRFLSNMSYHIRIPLNGVVGFSQLIASESNMTDEVRKEYSSIIQKNSEELMRLVNDVLDLSRLEAGMMKFNIQEYGLTELCNEALYMARMRNEENICIRLGNETAPDLDIRIDTARFSQALLSTLTYPQKCEEKREIDFKVTHDTEKNMIRFRIINSPLADERFTSQEVYIRHEINRLLLEYFGGSYKVQANAGEKPTILFTYPLGKN